MFTGPGDDRIFETPHKLNTFTKELTVKETKLMKDSE
jgi:hypothetical protein